MSLSRLKSSNSAAIWIVAAFVFLLVAPYSLAQNGTSGRQSKKDLENKKKKLNDEINQINSMLTETKASKKSSLNVLVTLNRKISVRTELIATINAEINEMGREIKRSQNEINSLSKNLVKLKQEYARMIYFAQRNQDSYNKLMFIFAAGDFNQAYMRLKYFQQYSQFRKKQAQEILGTQTQLLAKLKELESKRQEKNALLGNENVEKENLSKEKQEQEGVLSELQNKEKELKAELEKKKRDAENLQIAIKKLIEAEIKRKSEEAAAAAAARAAANAAAKPKNIKLPKTVPKPKTATPPIAKSSDAEAKAEKAMVPELTAEAEALGADFVSNRGKLPWPVSKGIICESYGEHEHPAIKGFMLYNNGVDICANKGTQARAIFSGEVTGISNSPAGGKLVIIRHGEYLSVYSNLDEVFVKTGDKVTIKQAIGTILYSEDEGKTSMNLQIWKGQKTMDPAGWLYNAR